MANKEINTFYPLKATQKFTKPPVFLNSVSLCTDLDKLDILRPSMANGSITTLLEKRGYITNEKGTLRSTPLGEKVVDFLLKTDFCFINVQFTAEMEKELDAIANDSKDKLEVLTAFWSRLQSDLENAKKIKLQQQTTDYKCPMCDGNLILRHSKYGAFFACSNYKRPKKVKGKIVKQEGSCEYKANVGSNGEPVEKTKPEPKQLIFATFKCPKCQGDVVKKTSKFGKEFWACNSWPACATICDDNGCEIISKPKKWKKWQKPK